MFHFLQPLLNVDHLHTLQVGKTLDARLHV
jgi:hypothetical protein